MTGQADCPINDGPRSSVPGAGTCAVEAVPCECPILKANWSNCFCYFRKQIKPPVFPGQKKRLQCIRNVSGAFSSQPAVSEQTGTREA